MRALRVEVRLGLRVGVGWECVWGWAGSGSGPSALGVRMGVGWVRKFVCAVSGSGIGLSASGRALGLRLGKWACAWSGRGRALGSGVRGLGVGVS